MLWNRLARRWQMLMQICLLEWDATSELYVKDEDLEYETNTLLVRRTLLSAYTRPAKVTGVANAVNDLLPANPSKSGLGQP